MATTPLMQLQQLNVGQGGDSEIALWNKLIQNFSTLDGHTHTAGDGSLITTGAISINADLSFNGSAITELDSSQYVNRTSDVTPRASLYVKNDELLFRDGADNVVALTSGGSIAAAAGNITGLASPASVSFNSVQGEYSFFKDSGVYGELVSSTLNLYPLNGSTSFALGVTPGTLTESYTITLPTASPAGNNYMLQFTSAGVASFVPGLESLGVTAGQVVYATNDHEVDGVTIAANNLLLGNGAAAPTSGQLTNAYVSATAAIAGTKISPNFGSQNVVTTGTGDFGATTVDSLTSSSTLTVATTATFNGPVDITDANDTFDCAPPAVFTSTIAVDGAAAFNSSLDVNGLFTANGNVELGSNSSDTLTINAEIDSLLIPDADSTYSIGTNTKRWLDIYCDNAYSRFTLVDGFLDFNLQDEVTPFRVRDSGGQTLVSAGGRAIGPLSSQHAGFLFLESASGSGRYLWFDGAVLRHSTDINDVGTSGGSPV